MYKINVVFFLNVIFLGFHGDGIVPGSLWCLWWELFAKIGDVTKL
jgi:hypothetical protein